MQYSSSSFGYVQADHDVMGSIVSYRQPRRGSRDSHGHEPRLRRISFADRVRGNMVALLLVALCVLCSGKTLADEPPCLDEYPYMWVPRVPDSQSCDEDHGDFVSQCWSSHWFGFGGEYAIPQLLEGMSYGFPFNLDLMWGMMPGDYPPKSQDIQESTSPLIPATPGRSNLPVEPHNRPTLHGDYCLITGVPLYEQIDFELPFGGAIYRHVRTYSQVPIEKQMNNVYTPWPWGESWSWYGAGWMSSENPILLIDVAYPDIVGLGPRVSYFMPDAHRTIPFVFVAELGKYIAPPQFDATLEHNGTWISMFDDPNHPGHPEPGDPNEVDGGHWHERPTEYTIWLYGGSVRYTVEPHYEDVYDMIVGEDDQGNDIIRSAHDRSGPE